MTLHVFGAVCTHYGTAANNRGLTEGNTVTLQKLVWNGAVHTTVSAEAIRFALRQRLADHEETNRVYDDEARVHSWRDAGFKAWAKDGDAYIDDDLLGFMSAEAAKQEGSKGTAVVRRSVLEVTRAVSLTPWMGDVTFNAASPGATPSAQKKGGGNPVPYATEMHATQYQYGFAMTPRSLRKPSRARVALEALGALGEVAGNHGRFLYDFSPESIVLRVTHDPAPRLLYGFAANGERVTVDAIVRRVSGKDILASELILGGAVVSHLSEEDRGALRGARLFDGVRAACSAAAEAMEAAL